MSLNPHLTKNFADLYEDGTLKNGDTVTPIPMIYQIQNINEIKNENGQLESISYTVNNKRYGSEFRKENGTLDKYIKICGNSQSSPVQSSPGAGGGAKKKSKKQRNRKRRTRRN